MAISVELLPVVSMGLPKRLNRKHLDQALGWPPEVLIWTI